VTYTASVDHAVSAAARSSLSIRQVISIPVGGTSASVKRHGAGRHIIRWRQPGSPVTGPVAQLRNLGRRRGAAGIRVNHGHRRWHIHHGESAAPLVPSGTSSTPRCNVTSPVSVTLSWWRDHDCAGCLVRSVSVRLRWTTSTSNAVRSLHHCVGCRGNFEVLAIIRRRSTRSATPSNYDGSITGDASVTEGASAN